MTKFLNISTDTTLGGNSPSDETVSSQKAVKTYIDAHASGSPSWGSITGTLSDQTDLKNALDDKVTANTAITGATKCKITYDSKGLVTAGADLQASDIPDLSSTYQTTLTQGTGISISSGTISVTDPTLVNRATNSTSLTIWGSPASGINTINIGKYSTPTGVNSIMIGAYSKAGEGGMAFGNGAEAKNYSLAYLGKTSVNYAYQIGRGTNSETYSLYVGWGDDTNYKLLDNTGIIPSDRISVMTGADGTNAGTKGLVPAPAATDNTKYLKGNGTFTQIAYSEISGTPTIPIVNNATLTITQGGTTKGTFTANASSNVTIDLDSGGSVDVDNKSITTNSSDEIQTVGVINSQDSSTAIKTWTGTKAQYDAITTKDSATLYNITDDTTITQTILEALYPVGSVYITTANTCPLSTLISGSTWTLRSSGVVTSVNTSVPVKGTGMTLGLTNGTTGLALQDTMADSLSVSSYGYGKNVGIPAGTIEATTKVLGITTDPDKSGIVGTVTRTTLAVNIFERTA